jgi:hypothetical protein
MKRGAGGGKSRMDAELKCKYFIKVNLEQVDEAIKRGRELLVAGG